MGSALKMGTLFMAGAVFAAALTALGAAPSQEKAKEPAGQQPPASGEDVMNLLCLGCHDARPIQTQALDKEAWSKKVQAMIEKDQQVKPADMSTLVDYLAKEYGPVPEGNGKSILLNVCTQCHNLGRIKTHTATREEWDGTLSAMLNEGAPLSDEDYPVILNYLARNFKPK